MNANGRELRKTIRVHWRVFADEKEVKTANER
jgi:hypothetical protein